MAGVKRVDAVLFRTRWEAVEAIDREELRNASPERRLGLVAACMRTARALGLPGPSDDDPELLVVRERWSRLKAGRS